MLFYFNKFIMEDIMSIDLKKVADSISWYGSCVWKHELFKIPFVIDILWSIFVLLILISSHFCPESNGVTDFKNLGVFAMVDANVILCMALLALMSTSFISDSWKGTCKPCRTPGKEMTYTRDTFMRGQKFIIILTTVVVNLSLWIPTYMELRTVMKNLGIENTRTAASKTTLYSSFMYVKSYADIYADVHGIKNICLKSSSEKAVLGDCDELRKQLSASSVELEKIARDAK